MKKAYIKPSIKDFRLQSAGCMMNNASVQISDKEESDPMSDQSKAFWGITAFDDEEKIEHVDNN